MNIIKKHLIKKANKIATEQEVIDELLKKPKDEIKDLLTKAMENSGYYGDVKFITTFEKARKFVFEDYEPSEQDIKQWNTFVDDNDDFVYIDCETMYPDDTNTYRGMTLDELIKDIKNPDRSRYFMYFDVALADLLGMEI